MHWWWRRQWINDGIACMTHGRGRSVIAPEQPSSIAMRMPKIRNVCDKFLRRKFCGLQKHQWAKFANHLRKARIETGWCAAARISWPKCADGHSNSNIGVSRTRLHCYVIFPDYGICCCWVSCSLQICSAFPKSEIWCRCALAMLIIRSSCVVWSSCIA